MSGDNAGQPEQDAAIVPIKHAIPKPRRGSRGKQQAQQNTAREHERQAFELRKAGASYGAIARQVGFADESGAYKAVRRVLQRLVDETMEDAADVRRMELERLDQMFRTLWLRVLNGDLASVDRALRVMERRARLLGLDAPVKQETDIGPIEVVVRRVTDWDGR